MKSFRSILPLLAAAAVVAAASPASAAEALDGKLVSNGKAHPLKFASVYFERSEERNYDGDVVSVERLNLALTEKAPPAGKALDDEFVSSGELGHYVIAEFDPETGKKVHDSVGGPDMRITINHGGGGMLAAEDVKLAGGKLSGRLHTEGEEEFFGEKVAVDATFSVAVD